VVQAHHQQGRVDVADDDHARHLVAPIVQAARQLVQRRGARHHPPLAKRVALGQNPVAHGQGITLIGQLGAQGGQKPPAVLVFTIVQRDGLALNFGDAQRHAALVLLQQRARTPGARFATVQCGAAARMPRNRSSV
jgi:hypothetical protein